MSVAAVVKQHPELIGLAVLVVVILAYMARSSGGSSSSEDVTFTGGGTIPRPVDPGVVAIEEARIQAGSQNFGTLAQLILGTHTSDNELAGYEYGVAANERVQSQTIGSQERVALGAQTAAVTAAGITADAQRTVSAANADLERYRIDAQSKLTLEGQATERDVARVQAKSQFWGNLIGGVADVVKSFNPFSWF